MHDGARGPPPVGAVGRQVQSAPGSLRSVSSCIMEASLCLFFHTIWGPPDHFLRLLYGAPQITFFSYNMGAPLRSVSLFTICPPPPLRSVSLHAIGGATSHFSFFTKYMGGPSDQFLRLLYGAPQVSFFAYYMGSPQISFCAYFLGPLSDQFFLLLYGAPSDQFLHILYGGPLRSLSSPTIWGSPEISFFAYYMRAPLRSVSSLTIWGPH